jgi:hypothetical protein
MLWDITGYGILLRVRANSVRRSVILSVTQVFSQNSLPPRESIAFAMLSKFSRHVVCRGQLRNIVRQIAPRAYASSASKSETIDTQVLSSDFYPDSLAGVSTLSSRPSSRFTFRCSGQVAISLPSHHLLSTWRRIYSRPRFLSMGS